VKTAFEQGGIKMTGEMIKILLIEDNPADARLIREMLNKFRSHAFECACADRLSTGLNHLAENRPDIILLDLGLPDSQGLDTLTRLKDSITGIPVVVVAVLDDEVAGRSTVNMGAQDYLLKGKINGKALWRVISYSIERNRFREELKRSENRFKELFNNIGNCVAVYETVNNGENFIIKDLNRAAERIEGIRKDEVLGKLVTDVFPGVVDMGLFSIFQRVWKTGESEHQPVSFYKDRIMNGWKENYVYKLPTGEIVDAYEDVTKRKQSESALRESEEHSRLLTKLSPSPLCLNNRGEIEYVNDRFTAIFGYTVEDIPNVTTWFRRAYPDEKYRQEVQNSWNEAEVKSKRENRPFEAREYSITCKDGTVCIAEVSWVEIDSKQLVVFNDVTERQRIEEDLRKSAEFSKDLLQNAPNPVLATNLDTSIRYINPAFEKLTGFTLNELTGCKCPYPWWPEENFQEFENANTAGRTKELNVLERHYQKKNGERFWVTTSIKPVNDDREVEYYLSNWLDITERKKADESLRESEEHFRLLTKLSPTPLVVINEHGEIQYLNDRCIAAFGYTIEDTPNMEAWFRLAYPDEKYRHEEMAAWQKIAADSLYEKKGIDPRESKIRGKDGSFRIVEASGTRIGNKMLIALNDITGRKKLEDELEQSVGKLDQALQGTIDAMAKMVELRDPYTAGHQRKVAKLSVAIARELNLPEEQVKSIGVAAVVHDIGKMYVPTEILSRTGILTDLEFKMMRTHVDGSYDILKSIEFPWPVAQIVLQHHERLDGSGYPSGLKDGSIRQEARILAVADVVEAISSHRPYRSALGIAAALEEITKNKGILYDSEAVEACSRLFNEKAFKLE
jgi:PAS domain S-box-containing protein/putative nucleotidyltransferase with HDIG domain